MPKPTVGRIVLYTLSEDDAQRINTRRSDAEANLVNIVSVGSGLIQHHGNKAEAGQTLPMVIVRVWSETTVNGQVLLDGNDTLWKTSATKADDYVTSGRWAWPVVTR